MSLDYWDPEKVVNFRDVGEFINMIAGENLLCEGRLFRGGTLRHVESLAAVRRPKTIFCLQRGGARKFDGVQTYHFPISNDCEKYDTSDPAVRRWLRSVLGVLEGGVDFPLYVHCLSGKDRTGVVVATLLSILDVPRRHIIEEYLLSEGDVRRAQIETALDGVQPLHEIFHAIDTEAIRSSLRGAQSAPGTDTD